VKLNMRHPHDLHLEDVLKRGDPFEHAMVPAGDSFLNVKLMRRSLYDFSKALAPASGGGVETVEVDHHFVKAWQ
jgi:hypothetical protein